MTELTKCDLCGDVVPGEEAFVLSISNCDGLTLQSDDLCKSCKRTICRLIQNIRKRKAKPK